MIGYYVHHVGRGHLHRALAVAAELEHRGETVTGLSSLERPPGWAGPWETLPADDGAPAPVDPTAHGRLHWAPRHHDGLRDRMARLGAWIAAQRPAAVVVDVIVEVALLTRLHGVAVAYVVLPGHRGDPAHLLGLGVADRLVGCWPREARGMVEGLPSETVRRLVPVGGLSRFDGREPGRRGQAVGRVDGAGPRRVLLLSGAGGAAPRTELVARARHSSPGWRWTVLGVAGASRADWVDDPWPALTDADVVVTHAGQNAVAETAWARKPAVVVPQERPHAEQVTTAGVLSRGRWPVEVVPSWPEDGWPDRLARVAALEATSWERWSDGSATRRFADVVLDLVAEVGSARSGPRVS